MYRAQGATCRGKHQQWSNTVSFKLLVLTWTKVAQEQWSNVTGVSLSPCLPLFPFFFLSLSKKVTMNKIRIQWNCRWGWDLNSTIRLKKMHASRLAMQWRGKVCQKILWAQLQHLLNWFLFLVVCLLYWGSYLHFQFTGKQSEAQKAICSSQSFTIMPLLLMGVK